MTAKTTWTRRMWRTDRGKVVISSDDGEKRSWRSSSDCSKMDVSSRCQNCPHQFDNEDDDDDDDSMTTTMKKMTM
jgi:hypothetical protein